jgi:capsular exopolysaccharide synthesis family protein
MVTSALPGEGKTLLASNVALVLSGSFGRRVLLIDGDLRRPCLHTVFGTRNSSPSPIRLSDTLSLIPGGEPQDDPIRMLTAGPMRTFLRDASNVYDWVILDTPPVGLLPDAPLLAANVDRVLLVIRAASTPYDAIQKTVEHLGKDRILGTVLNRADSSEVAPYGVNYYGGYVSGQKRDLSLMEAR